MSHSPEQKRQKEAAQQEAERHQKYAKVDSMDSSLGDRLKDAGKALLGDKEAHSRMANREEKSLNGFYGNKEGKFK